MTIAATRTSAAAPPPRALGKPPPGRRRADQIQGGHHGLSRSAVVSSQRGRIVEAMIRLIGMRPFGEVTVVDLVTTAGVSRKTFYEQFSNKEEVFVEAYDQALRGLLAVMSDGAETSRGRRDRLDVRVTALLAVLASEEAIARVCFVEVAAAGPLALERRRQGTAELAAGLLGFDEGGEVPLTALAAAGGLSEVIHHEIVAGRGARLVGLAPDMVKTVVGPIWAEAGWK